MNSIGILKAKWPIMFIVGLFLSSNLLHSQEREVADSLIRVLSQSNFEIGDTTLNRIYSKIAFHHSNPDTSILYATKLVESANSSNDRRWLMVGHYSLGTASRQKGNLDVSINHYLKCLELAVVQDDSLILGRTMLALGDVYSIIGNHDNSISYYNKSISILKKSDDSVSIASALLNAGDEYFNVDKFDSALIYFEESGKIFESVGYQSGTAYSLGNIGLVYAEQSKHGLAEQNIREASNILQELGDLYPISVYLTYMADIYLEKGDLSRALQYAHESLDIGEELGLKEQIRDASLKLSDLYKRAGDYRKAYSYQTQYIAFRDSINNEETIRKMADLRTEFEVGQKQAEVDLLTAEKKNQQRLMLALAVILLLILLVALILYRNYREKNRINMLLEGQKAALEALNQTKDRFFSIISHDLRGPVSAFHGISRMIKFLVTTKNTDQLIELAEDIDHSVDRLSALLDNLLNWALQQQGHFPNVPEKVSLNELFDDLVSTLSNMASAKNIDLKADAGETILLWVDRNTTMTIIRNLVNNALKFTPEGGKIALSATQEGDFAQIKVKDTGVGIPKEKLDSLFKLTDKKSTYGTQGEKGLGLGLQLVHEFIEMNRGSIEVKSDRGKGTVFIVSLPLFERQQVEA